MKPKFKRGDLFKISKEYYYITKYKAERLDCDFKDLPKVSGVGSVLEFDNINEDEEEYSIETTESFRELCQ